MRWYMILFVLAIFNVEAKVKRSWQKKFVIKKKQSKKKERLCSNNAQEDRKKEIDNCPQVATSAVTYELNGGRFGDNLSSYCRAMWLSYRYNIPLLYNLFKYAKQLALDNHGLLMNKKMTRQFKRKFTIPNHDRYKVDRTNGSLYTVGWKSKIPVDWNDQHFMSLLKKCIALSSHTSPTIEMPENHISVAVHVRTGGDYAPDKRIQSKQPKRFVPKQFYIDQIKRIRVMFEGKNLYVHIFTDDSNPKALIKDFKKGIDDECITYGCRTQGNNHRKNVLEDFFAITTFDCLIRPESLYSIYAERLGSHKIVIYPVRVDPGGRKRKCAVREIVIKKRTPDGCATERIKV